MSILKKTCNFAQKWCPCESCTSPFGHQRRHFQRLKKINPFGRKLTAQFADDAVPVVEALPTGHTVGHEAGGSTGTAVTLVSTHPLETLTGPSVAVTLQCR